MAHHAINTHWPVLDSSHAIRILLLTVFLLCVPSVHAWYYASHPFRFPAAIVNGTTQTLTNQPILLLLDTASLITAGQLRADGADLRITSRTDAPLPFWIEPNTINSTNTRVWIGLDSLPSNDTETVYLYHGETNATAAGNITNTFPSRISATSRLMAAWLMDEATGTTANDSSGNGNHATLNNVTWTTGHADDASALHFNGSNACLSVAHATSLNPTNAFAAEMWIKPEAVFPGWLTPWLYRRPLSVSNTLITANLTNFPVLVKLTNTTFTFTNALATGYDIRFTAADGQTPLSFERERHTSTAAEYWVRLPLVAASTNTTFYIYYGNTNALNAASASNVWDSQFAMVHHLAQSSSPVYDSTSNANHGVSNRTALGQSGLIGNGILLAANEAYIECGTTAMPRTQDAQTLEVWAYYTSAPTAPASQNLLVSVDASSSSAIQLGFRSGRAATWLWGGLECATSAAPAHSQWHQYVFVTEGNSTSHALYIDGKRYAGLTRALLTGTPKQIRISTSEWGEYFLGRIDEARISRGARSDAWITANYQSTRNALLQYGAQETRNAVLAGKGRNAWQLETDPARRLHFYLNNTLLLSSTPIETNWLHLVFNYDGSTRSILLNGSSLTSTAYSTAITANSSNIVIGTNFPGMISGMRLFNRTLTTQEIDTLRLHYAYTTTNYPGTLLLCPANPASLTTSPGQTETWANPASMPPTRNPFHLEPDTALSIPFDAGPITADRSPYAHPITAQGTWIAPGQHQLDGAGDYLTIPDAPAIDDSPAITCSIWINLAALPASTAALLAKSESYSLALESDGHLTFRIASTDAPVRSLSTLTTGQLHQVAAVFDGTLPAEQRIRLYLNGHLDQSGASTHSAIPRTPTSDLCIGAETPVAPVTLNATLGPIQLMRNALGPAQILNLEAGTRRQLSEEAP